MRRIPEPELMIDRSQVKAYADADFSASEEKLINSLLEFISAKEIPKDSLKLIIDLGCGPGNIAERVSLRWPNSTVIGIDGSVQMIELANHRKRIRFPKFKNLNYLCCDLSEIDNFPGIVHQSANLIISNSCLHHLHDPNVFWKVSKDLAAPGSLQCHRDLRRPLSMNEALKLVDIKSKNAPIVLKKDYFASLLAAFTVEEVKSQLIEASLDELKVNHIDDNYLQIVGTI